LVTVLPLLALASVASAVEYIAVPMRAISHSLRVRLDAGMRVDIEEAGAERLEVVYQESAPDTFFAGTFTFDATSGAIEVLHDGQVIRGSDFSIFVDARSTLLIEMEIPSVGTPTTAIVFSAVAEATQVVGVSPQGNFQFGSLPLQGFAYHSALLDSNVRFNGAGSTSLQLQPVEPQAEQAFLEEFLAGDTVTFELIVIFSYSLPANQNIGTTNFDSLFEAFAVTNYVPEPSAALLRLLALVPISVIARWRSRCTTVTGGGAR
jgi:hypothetical protein